MCCLQKQFDVTIPIDSGTCFQLAMARSHCRFECVDRKISHGSYFVHPVHFVLKTSNDRNQSKRTELFFQRETCLLSDFLEMNWRLTNEWRNPLRSSLKRRNEFDRDPNFGNPFVEWVIWTVSTCLSCNWKQIIRQIWDHWIWLIRKRHLPFD